MVLWDTAGSQEKKTFWRCISILSSQHPTKWIPCPHTLRGREKLQTSISLTQKTEARYTSRSIPYLTQWALQSVAGISVQNTNYLDHKNNSCCRVWKVLCTHTPQPVGHTTAQLSAARDKEEKDVATYTTLIHLAFWDSNLTIDVGKKPDI